MPVLHILSNQRPSAGESALLKELSHQVAQMLGKPERYVMLSYTHNPHLLFAGSDAPLAYLELKSIGLPESEAAGFSQALCAAVGERLAVAQDRIYIEFADAAPEMWGWNGMTFA